MYVVSLMLCVRVWKTIFTVLFKLVLLIIPVILQGMTAILGEADEAGYGPDWVIIRLKSMPVSARVLAANCAELLGVKVKLPNERLLWLELTVVGFVVGGV